MVMKNKFIKRNPSDRIWWLINTETKGEFIFSFNRKKLYNMFSDYPHKLSKKEKLIFDKENPYWADFFSDRTYNG